MCSPKNRFPIVPVKSRGEIQGDSMPSIPSRRVTHILATAGDREANGFGSQTSRFHEKNICLDEASDAPGPGSYGAQPTFHEESGAKASLGIKGTGNFASRSRRFRPVAPGGPGPGKYDQEKIPARPQSLEACQSAQFATPTSYNPQKVNVRPSPGPGSYDAKESANSMCAQDSIRNCRAAFQGKDGRDPFHPGEEKPGPGYYSARSSSTPPGAACRFKGPIQRPLMSVTPGLPTASLSTADQAGDYVKRVGAVPTEVPGPGHYDQERPIESKKQFSTFGTGAFQKGMSHHSRKWEQTGPSPADYERPMKWESQGAKAQFTSGSQRSDPAKAGAPGPAFYSPRMKSGAESFHLNIQRKWL